MNVFQRSLSSLFFFFIFFLIFGQFLFSMQLLIFSFLFLNLLNPGHWQLVYVHWVKGNLILEGIYHDEKTNDHDKNNAFPFRDFPKYWMSSMITAYSIYFSVGLYLHVSRCYSNCSIMMNKFCSFLIEGWKIKSTFKTNTRRYNGIGDRNINVSLNK